MTAYYNENNPYAAQWLRNLIAAGHIAAGDVDERSIVDVRADDLRAYTQCHFFAGIGVWSHALHLAGWPDDRPVWTGSCPCQPFSVAGTGKGTADERHLWPVWNNLIQALKPSVIFGEQVEAALRHGWLDIVFDDLENAGYATGAICLPAACVGAPHIRQRAWFVADSQRQQRQKPISRPRKSDCENGSGEAEQFTGLCSINELGNTNSERFNWQSIQHQQWSKNFKAAGTVSANKLGNTSCPRLEGYTGHGHGNREWPHSSGSVTPAGISGGFWDAADWLYCRDGKYRPVEPGTQPLAHGITNRVGRLCAYGNAIVPEAAAEVIAAYMEWAA